jgi:prolyl-tRNA synthetase
MTRLSAYFLPTEKQAPADAEALSHKLLVRAGMVRQVGAGLWTWLPAGWRVHQRVAQIIREEMNAVGALEMLMPVLLPAEPWKRSGRYGIEELFKLKDRKGADLVLAMTHEEIVTLHVAQVVRSYRELPLTLYHIQTKERDELRPRAGVLRTREFVMKDAYTFDRDAAGLDERYALQAGAYERVMERCGLRYYRVEADVGMMGGHGADEFMAPCPAGENEIALAPGYAANVEVARADAQPVELPSRLVAPEEVGTPGLTTVAEVAAALGVAPGALLKAYPVVSEGEQELVLVVVRGDHRVNDIKLTNALRSPWRPAQEGEIAEALGPPGFIGPVGLDGAVRVLLDEAVLDGGYVTGANRGDTHLRGVEPGRDFSFERADVRSVEAGDTVNGQAITIEPAIEVGNIFKLGTRYSEPLGATYVDENGREQPIWMGSYGIGPARIAAAAVEQYADEHGISWPRSVAPFDVHVVGLGRPDTPERELAEDVYAVLREAGLDVLYDDRDAGPGEKFADAELLGCPLRLTIGKRSVESAAIEVQRRRGREDAGPLPIEPQSTIPERVRELLEASP